MSALADTGLSSFFATAAGEFDCVAGREVVVERRLRFGDRRVLLRFAGRGLAEVLMPAFATSGDDANGTPLATISLWDERACPEGSGRYPWGAADIGPGGLVHGSNRDRIVAVHEPHSGALTLVDRAGRALLHRVPDCRAVPWWERAAPLRAALYWALTGQGRHLVHAGAVGDERGGVLLAGASGSGKTTVALAALVDGFGYLADDYVLLHDPGELTAYAIYQTAKLDDGHLARFATLAHQVRFPPPHEAAEKAVLDVGAVTPASRRESLAVRSVIVPRIRGGRAVFTASARRKRCSRLHRAPRFSCRTVTAG